MSKHKSDTTDAETNEYGDELDKTVWRKGNDNGKNVSVYHTSADCTYLDREAASVIPCKVRTLPNHRPCKKCTGDIDRAGQADFKGLRNMINDVDECLDDSLWITRSAWERDEGSYHSSQTCSMILRADDYVEITVKSVPNIPHSPCDYCCNDDLREVEEILTDRYNVDNPDKRLTVGDLYQKQKVHVCTNSNHNHLVHLSEDCQHMQQASSRSRKTARTLHDDRGICNKCAKGWTKQDAKSEHNLASRLRGSDNPKETLEQIKEETKEK